jgi:hypothetical protein
MLPFFLPVSLPPFFPSSLPGLHTCKAGTLPLEPNLQFVLFLLFRR